MHHEIWPPVGVALAYPEVSDVTAEDDGMALNERSQVRKPQQGGMNARAMQDDPRHAYLLLHAEPEFDFANAVVARAALEKAVAGVAGAYANAEVPRPAHWSGFRVTPLEIEFWHDRPFRLHQRLVFRRPAPAEAWVSTALYP